MPEYSVPYIRSQIIGNDTLFATPFGQRNLFYADFTASGRGLRFIERKMANILRSYANSHTEDDYTGIFTTRLLHQAEKKIKSLVNASADDRVLFVGTGATGALERLQKIIGIYQSPVTRERCDRLMVRLSAGYSPARIEEARREFCPVVFISSYEHHSNELMWRESLAQVVVIRLNDDGEIDLKDLERKLSDPRFSHRDRFASFSAGSNITGLKTDIYETARICHDHDTPVFFDFAAIAPYEEIDMNRDGRSYFDAIFFSPHKFLGGPGTSGILVFNKKLYRSDLPPTTAGGGTVDYVGFFHHDFSREIEVREKPGTPGILQAVKSALVMELKEKIGTSRIQETEKKNLEMFFSALKDHPGIQFLGNLDLTKRIPIVSFNVKHKDRILHPKFVTKMLNDLFGIQSRAGCSCAGPYGHILLDIDDQLSERYRQLISAGMAGLKPGWVRINLHYTFSKTDMDFLIRAIRFVADYGYLFLHKYVFHIFSGEWRFQGFRDGEYPLELDNSFETHRFNLKNLSSERELYFQEAEKWVRKLKSYSSVLYKKDEEPVEGLKYFYYIHIDQTPAGDLNCCTV